MITAAFSDHSIPRAIHLGSSVGRGNQLNNNNQEGKGKKGESCRLLTDAGIRLGVVRLNQMPSLLRPCTSCPCSGALIRKRREGSRVWMIDKETDRHAAD